MPKELILHGEASCYATIGGVSLCRVVVPKELILYVEASYGKKWIATIPEKEEYMKKKNEIL